MDKALQRRIFLFKFLGFKFRRRFYSGIFNVRNFLDKFGWHWWDKRSAICCGNVAQINRLKDEQRYLYRRCRICYKEMPFSRYYFNIRLKEKNAFDEKTDSNFERNIQITKVVLMIFAIIWFSWLLW